MYKIGDRIIITENHYELLKGQEFIIHDIDSKDKNQSYGVINKYSGGYSWPHNDKIVDSIPYLNEQKLRKALDLDKEK